MSMLKILSRFFGFIAKYKWQVFIFLLILIISSIGENLLPYVYKLLIDNISKKNYEPVIVILFLYVGLRISANWLEALTHYLGDRVLFSSAKDARIKIFRYIQDLDFAFHVNKNTGSLISAFKRGDNAFFNFFDDITFVLKIFIGLVVILFFFSTVTPLISYIMVLVFIGNIILSWFLIKKNIKKRAVFNDSEDDISSIITDNLINYETVKFFAKEDREEKRLTERFVGWTKDLWGYANSFRLMDIAIGTFSNLGIFIIYYILIRKIVTNEITLGDFVMIISFTTGFYYQFFEMLYKLRSMAKNVVDLTNYFSILDNKIIVQDPIIPQKVKNPRGEIVFDNVCFNYFDNVKNVLNNFSLKIDSCQSVAFVGRSGAGKTTLIKILLRFYDVTGGEIRIDGVNIKHLNKNDLRSLMGVVPQEPILFNNTIGYNISYGCDTFDQKMIIKAAQDANLHDFISSLTKGYDTQVGERGIKLSGGQKQRLAIARMLMANPKIVIFDEATSNLDSESEKLIQKSLKKISGDKTVLIVAHRFSTVRNADKIVVLEEGSIVESGTHKELISDPNGLYNYLWSLQVKGNIDEEELEIK